MSIRLKSYHYSHYSTTNKKAICVIIGDFKLYFSYNTLIAFETPTDQYITAKKHSFTTSGHKWSARNVGKNTHAVDQKVLELITFTELLKQPFKEARSNANLRCERVH